MATIFDALKSSGVRKTNEVHPLFDAEAFPNVSLLLFGVGNSAGDGYDQPPRNMTLFQEGDVLKVVFGCGDDYAKLYTTVGDLAGLLDQVEAQLAKGAFSWKEPKPVEKRAWRKS